SATSHTSAHTFSSTTLFRSPGHSVFLIQPHTADAAALIPAHAACTTLRNVSLFLYASMNAPTRSITTVTTIPIGFARKAMFRSRSEEHTSELQHVSISYAVF